MTGLRPLTVGELRAELDLVPDHRPMLVQIVVGGDLDTDDVALVQVGQAGYGEVYVRLEPDADAWPSVRGLIAQGLAWQDSPEDEERDALQAVLIEVLGREARIFNEDRETWEDLVEELTDRGVRLKPPEGA